MSTLALISTMATLSFPLEFSSLEFLKSLMPPRYFFFFSLVLRNVPTIKFAIVLVLDVT